MFIVGAALLGLIALLATLQYRWLGSIRDGERERMTATLNTRASAFAQDFDRELTRAYVMFQVDTVQDVENVAARVAARYDRWQATARYPRMLKDVYLVPRADESAPELQRFNPSTRFVEPAEWPESLAELKAHVTSRRDSQTSPNVVMRTAAQALWDDVPAILVPTPMLVFNHTGASGDVRLVPQLSYTVLILDREYITAEMLGALAQQHFHGAGDVEYQLAVVRHEGNRLVYRSAESFSPRAGDKADAAAELFQINMQQFGALAAEVRRFTTFLAATPRGSHPIPAIPQDGAGSRTGTIIRETIVPGARGQNRMTIRETPSMSIFVQGAATAQEKAAVEAGAASSAATRTALAAPRWRLLVKHPSGSLEQAINTARRRNLMISSSILAVLGVSLGFLVVTTRRAQDLARQQMEFVAAVSHELRTPLAVIRSAADNLAEGVVHDQGQIRKYGELVREEGRRLTEMVEQILEFAGIQSGQRGFALRPVAVRALVEDVLDASRTLVEAAGLKVDLAIPDSLPPVLGDETALRRMFQNLIGNAIKYGAPGGWIGIEAKANGREVVVDVSDKGIGIDAAEQQKIFEPFYRAPEVIAAQIQGAGLGLSLVKRIVEAHGGRIVVRSTPREGSTFSVHLPSAGEEPVRTMSESPASPAAAPTPHHS